MLNNLLLTGSNYYYNTQIDCIETKLNQRSNDALTAIKNNLKRTPGNSK